MNYEVISNIPDHVEIQDSIALEVWPEFMLHDPVADKNWMKLFELFPECQISLKSQDEIVGTANSLPFYWDRSFRDLPEEGWDWVFQKGIDDSLKKIKPNVLNGLQIVVNRKHQGKGISTYIVNEMKNIAKEKGFEYLVIPVRPSLKSKYPLTSIDNYITWHREDGLPLDPWLRVHVRAGGEILKPCHKAMNIPGTVKEWESWSGMVFPETSDYVVEGALTPVSIDIETDRGVYIEPNVWVLHRI